jgi:alginate O-acetyltransferase complex protein AlgI
VATLLAKYQIYCDFSGYTDIALGSSLMLGFKLVPNFNRPFFAKNITEYWNRWHMSLSHWIKNYIFYPLLSTPATIFGARGIAVITFLLLGLWHGGTFNFIIYGLIQGILIVLDSSTKTWRLKFYKNAGLNNFPKTLNAFCTAFTFFILVVPPTLFFRSAHFSTSLELIHNLKDHFWDLSTMSFVGKSEYLKQGLLTAIPAIIFFEIIDWIQKTKFDIADYLTSKSAYVFYIFVIASLIVIFVLGKFDAGSRFIYTQF